MIFNVPCDTYIRMSYFMRDFHTNASAWLRGLYLENHKGHSFAIATNRKVGAIEYLGPTTERDGNTTVAFNEALLKQAETEKAFKGKIQFIANPVISHTVAKTTFGFMLPVNAGLYLNGNNELIDTWRKLMVDPPKSSKGAMYWQATQISILAKAAPSGQVDFPAHINCELPVLLRDHEYDHWAGFFMPDYQTPEGQRCAAVPAVLPDWKDFV